MKLLLDEPVPVRLREEFPGHRVSTVSEMRWNGKTNGELLLLAAGAFDVFVTVDQNLQYQQNLEHANIAVVVLAARSSHINDLRPVARKALDLLATARPGKVLVIR